MFEVESDGSKKYNGGKVSDAVIFDTCSWVDYKHTRLESRGPRVTVGDFIVHQDQVSRINWTGGVLPLRGIEE